MAYPAVVCAPAGHHQRRPNGRLGESLDQQQLAVLFREKAERTRERKVRSSSLPNVSGVADL